VNSSCVLKTALIGHARDLSRADQLSKERPAQKSANGVGEGWAEGSDRGPAEALAAQGNPHHNEH
jgi:hypothetical protein